MSETKQMKNYPVNRKLQLFDSSRSDEIIEKSESLPQDFFMMINKSDDDENDEREEHDQSRERGASDKNCDDTNEQAQWSHFEDDKEFDCSEEINDSTTGL